MKRLILTVMMILLLVGAVASPVFAAQTQESEPTEPTEPVTNVPREPGWCGEEITWSYAEGTLVLTGNGEMDDFPEGAPWKEYADELHTVILSGSIHYIGAYSFEDCDAITAVNLGNNLRELGKRAFYSCDGLTELTLPATFRVFGEESLMRCTFLKEIHCLGGMPSFRLNCLWDTWADIFYPVDNPWPLVHIEQLEGAFQGRIEFLAEDGYDPYVPTEPTEETTEPTEETTEPTEETTEPTEETTEPTEETNEPTGETTPPPQETEPPATQPPETTAPPSTEPLTEPVPETTQPQKAEKDGPGSGVGMFIVGMVLSVFGLGTLIFSSKRSRRRSSKSSGKGRYSR